MFRLSMLVLVATFASAAVAAAPAPWKVYVYTAEDPGGFVDQAVTDRRASLTDVRRAFEDGRYRERFTLVERPELADFTLEVAWRGALTTDKTTGSVSVLAPGTAIGSQSPVLQQNLKLILRVRDHQQEFWGAEPNKTNWAGNIPYQSWKALAAGAVTHVAAWVQENDAALRR